MPIAGHASVKVPKNERPSPSRPSLASHGSFGIVVCCPMRTGRLLNFLTPPGKRHRFNRDIKSSLVHIQRARY